MSSRTLRLLISLSFIFGIFIYMASVQVTSLLPVKAPDEGQLGGPIPGLTRWQLAKFYEGKGLFEKSFTPEMGLGPLYNGQSCAQCHGKPEITGGAAQNLDNAKITLFARRVANGRFAKDSLKAILTKTEAKDLDYMTAEGGPLLLRHSITQDFKDTLALAPDCKMEAMKEPPKSAEFLSVRLAPQVYGLGLVNSIPDPAFDFNSGLQWRAKNGITGKAVHPDLFLWGWSGVGKFGLKAQDSTLFTICGAELNQNMGITNPVQRKSLTPKGPGELPAGLAQVDPNEPNDKSVITNKISFYLNTLAPPARAPITPEIEKGERLFFGAGCAVCHVAKHDTTDKVMLLNPDGPAWESQETEVSQGVQGPRITMTEEPKYVEIKALESKPLFPYSDFLVHDMGASLADGYAQGGAGGSQWRTSPLWGLRHRKFFLHDGRTIKLEEAITMHGGEAAKTVQNYKKLPDADRRAILAFLKSL